MIISIDFDNTIHDTKNVSPGYKMGKPIEGAIEAVKKLKKSGNEIVILSARASNESSKKAISDWLDYFDIPYDEVTNVKESSDVYIDDKAIHFDNWENVLSQLGGFRGRKFSRHTQD